MKIQISKYPEVDTRQWHKWWAWFPVYTMENDAGYNHWVWLGWVERKLTGNWDTGFVYRLPESC